jgi:hypothetical protein
LTSSEEHKLNKPWFEHAEFYVSALSVTIAVAALWYSWQVSTTEREINRIDARIANCTAVAGTYLEQAKVYGWPEYDSYTGQFLRTVLDEDNGNYASTALTIARAAQLCRISKGDLTTCIEERVDGVSKHFVVDVGTDGAIYKNPVC